MAQYHTLKSVVHCITIIKILLKSLLTTKPPISYKNRRIQNIMNYITQINIFYGFVIEDNRLTAFHISMYFGLFQLWNKNRFENPLPISRKEVMIVSKIGSTHTYYKILSELHNWGYIEYVPEKNPLKNSHVYMKVLKNNQLEEVNPFIKNTKAERVKKENTLLKKMR